METGGFCNWLCGQGFICYYIPVTFNYSVIPPSKISLSEQLLGCGQGGDVFKGQYAGTPVAVKVLRTLVEEDDLDEEIILAM